MLLIKATALQTEPSYHSYIIIRSKLELYKNMRWMKMGGLCSHFPIKKMTRPVIISEFNQLSRMITHGF